MSPAWTLLAALAFLVLAGRKRIVELARTTAGRAAAALVALAGVGWIAWTAAYGLPPLLGRPTEEPARGAGVRWIAEAVPERIHSLVGNLGGARPPLLVLLLWLLALLALASRAEKRTLYAVIVLSVAAAAVAVAVELWRYPEIGRFWQARYSLPVVTGVPLLLASRATWQPSPRARRAFAGALVALHVGLLGWGVHEYRWFPTYGVLFVGVTLVGAWAVWLTFRGPGADMEV